MDTGPLLVLLTHPLVVLSLGLGLLIAAARTGRKDFALFGLAYGCYAAGVVLQITLWPATVPGNVLLSGVFYTLATLGFYLGILHFGHRRAWWKVVIPVTLVALAARSYLVLIDDHLVARLITLQGYFAIVLLLAAWQTRHLLRGSLAEKLMLVLVTCFGLSVLPRTLLAAWSKTSGYGFDGSLYWTTTVALFNLFTVLFVILLVSASAARLQRALQHFGEIDPLTGLYNRAGFDRHTARSLHQVPVYALIIIDLDHFKQINDTYGHAAGDQVLQKVATVIQAEVRRADIVARYGGEEFLVYLPALSTTDAEQLANRLRLAIASADFPDIDPDLRCTATLGVAGFTTQVSLPEAYAQVDALLYRGKAAGRNQVTGQGEGVAPVAGWSPSPP